MSRARRNRAHATRRVRPLEQETPRRARDFGLDMRRLKRLRVITFSILALPLLALALLAGKFVSMPITQAWHGSAYSQQQFTEAAERLSPVWVVNWFEPYLPHLTKGTDLLQDGKNAEAEKELQAALDTWEDGHDLNQPMHAQCKIRNNLAISIERQAAEIKDDGDRADRMFEAEQIITPCMSGGGGGDDDQGQGGGGDDGDDQGQGGDGDDGDDQGQGGDGDDEGTSSGDPDEDQGTGDEDEGTGNEDQGTTDDNGKRIEDERRDADKKAGNDPDEREKDQKGKDQDKGDQGGQDDGNGGPKDPGDPKREDPEGSEKPEEAPTEGDSTEEQKKKDELDKRNKDANDGEGEDDSDGGDDNPAKPW
jgi:hypothetical protein